MSRINDLHEEAMDFADNALSAQRRGDHEQAVVLFRRAFSLERDAADLLRNDLSAEPTRSILYRSAAALALDCREFDAAQDLIKMGLTGHPPEEIADELRELLEQVRSNLEKKDASSGLLS